MSHKGFQRFNWNLFFTVLHQVKWLEIHSCEDVILRLDLLGLDLARSVVRVRDCGTVRLESVITDRRRVPAPLVVQFTRVRNLTVTGLTLAAPIQVSPISNVCHQNYQAGTYGAGGNHRSHWSHGTHVTSETYDSLGCIWP